MKIAVITGASSGMGREFVYQLDALEKFDEIWVIARRRERLEALASETRANIRPIAVDLTKEEGIEQYKRMLNVIKPHVAVLVNASGFGKFGAFTSLSLEDQQNMIDLNVKAYVALTHITLPYMGKTSRIYNLDSLSAFMPLPYMSIYAATKAFVLSYSRSLNYELKKRGIKVLAVCPGWVKTEFMDRVKTDDSIQYYFRLYTPEAVVSKAISDMSKGHDVSVCGLATQAIVALSKVFPASLSMKFWCKQQKKD